MKFKRIEIENIYGIRKLIIEPEGMVNTIAGTNASGKSSAMKALRNIVEGGSLAPIRNVDAPDEEPSSIYVLLEYLGTDYEIDKHTTKKGESLSVKRRVGETIAFEKVEKPSQTFINGLFDKHSLNPLEFCSADDKKRVQLLLEAIDLEFDRSDMWEKIGLKYEDFPAVNEEQHPLKEIAEVRKNIFDKRTGINTKQDRVEKTADELRRMIPACMPPEPGDIAIKQAELNGEVAKLSGLKKDINQQHADRYREIESTLSEMKSKHAHMLERVKAENEIKLAKYAAELQKEYEMVREQANIEEESQKAELRADSEEADALKEERSIEVDELQARVTELTAEIASMQMEAEERAGIAERVSLMEKYASEAQSLRGQSEYLTEALAKLDSYKAAMTKELPIEGLDISDNVVKVHGVPWNQINTAAQDKIAVQVAIHRQVHLGLEPLLIMDGAEALDEYRFAEMEKTCEELGVSAWMARVTGIPFTVFSGPGAIGKIREAESANDKE